MFPKSVSGTPPLCDQFHSATCSANRQRSRFRLMVAVTLRMELRGEKKSPLARLSVPHDSIYRGS